MSFTFLAGCSLLAGCCRLHRLRRAGTSENVKHSRVRNPFVLAAPPCGLDCDLDGVLQAHWFTPVALIKRA